MKKINQFSSSFLKILNKNSIELEFLILSQIILLTFLENKAYFNTFFISSVFFVKSFNWFFLFFVLCYFFLKSTISYSIFLKYLFFFNLIPLSGRIMLFFSKEPKLDYFNHGSALNFLRNYFSLSILSDIHFVLKLEIILMIFILFFFFQFILKINLLKNLFLTIGIYTILFLTGSANYLYSFYKFPANFLLFILAIIFVIYLNKSKFNFIFLLNNFLVFLITGIIYFINRDLNFFTIAGMAFFYAFSMHLFCYFLNPNFKLKNTRFLFYGIISFLLTISFLMVEGLFALYYIIGMFFIIKSSFILFENKKICYFLALIIHLYLFVNIIHILLHN
ncbi:MAG: hypothetical protein ACQESP_13425 [Candidatus Muiribacteriota bacterium]